MPSRWIQPFATRKGGRTRVRAARVRSAMRRWRLSAIVRRAAARPRIKARIAVRVATARLFPRRIQFIGGRWL
jgi:hypothetical protein